MLIYEQKTHRLHESDVKGTRLIAEATLYSGHGPGKNDPLAQHIPKVGPLPEGFYALGDVDPDPHKHGPVAIHLVPLGGEMFGRSGFMLHADSIEHPGEASEGCVAGVPRLLRERLAAGTGNARLLAVVSQLSEPSC